jgi:hypothetical protein
MTDNPGKIMNEPKAGHPDATWKTIAADRAAEIERLRAALDEIIGAETLEYAKVIAESALRH